MELESVLGLGSGVAVHGGSPLQEADEFVALAEEESPKFQEADLIHLDPTICLDAPAQIRAAPRRKMMAAGGVPEEAKDIAQGSLSVFQSLSLSVSQFNSRASRLRD
jgi:hypothetical protein